MSTEQVLDIVKRRGMEVALEDGRPVLKRNGSKDGVTAALLAVLTRHRDRIIQLLTRQRGLFPEDHKGASSL